MRLKIGELARHTGLTVRTLHHYDAIGLLRPSARSESGYRLYTEDDIATLHRIQALKAFGFSLAETRTLLDSDTTSLRPLIARQMQVIEEQIARARRLRARLDLLQRQLSAGDAPHPKEWLRTLELMSMYEKHFTPDELKTLHAQWNHSEKGYMAPWRELIAQVRAAMEQGHAPESEVAQALATRGLELAEQMAGSDPQLMYKVRQLTEDNDYVRTATGFDAGTMDYLDHAMVAARTAHFARYLSAEEWAATRARFVSSRPAWIALVTEARALMQSGTPAAAPQARALAERWHALAEETHFANDPALRARLQAALTETPKLLAGTGIDQALLSYIWEATLEPLPYETEHGRPSPSAQSVALLRAAHHLHDTPRILDDPLAIRIIGPHNAHQLQTRPEWMNTPPLRAFRTAMALRSRFAEHALADALARGVRQYVILGAGLDTSAYRLPAPANLNIFEVDHPTMQGAKRACLARADIAQPPGLRFVAVDFESTHLEPALQAAGFDPTAPAFFSLLGVAMYLDAATLWATLQWIGARAPGSEIVFDYALAPEHLSPTEQRIHQALITRGAAQGEPWKCFLAPAELEAGLRAAGFTQVEQWNRDQLHARYLPEWSGSKLGNITQIAHARV